MLLDTSSAADPPVRQPFGRRASPAERAPARGPRRPDRLAQKALDTRRIPSGLRLREDREHQQHVQQRRSPHQPQAAEEEAGKPSNLQGVLLLNLGALLFASNQVVIKMAGTDHGAHHALAAADLSAIRFAIAALCFTPQVVKGLRKMTATKPALELGLLLFAGYTTQALGLAETSAAHGAFTGTFTVLAVPLLVGLSGRKIPLSTWIAAVVALIGVSLLTAGDGSFNHGDALCIASAIIFGVHKWRSETITAKFSDSTSELVAMQLAVLGAVSVAVALPPHLQDFSHSSLGDLWRQAQDVPIVACLYMGLASTAATLAIEMEALKTVSAPVAALIYTAEPVWGALGAWAVLGERWGKWGWVGAALVMLASLSAQVPWGDKKKAAKGA